MMVRDVREVTLFENLPQPAPRRRRRLMAAGAVMATAWGAGATTSGSGSPATDQQLATGWLAAPHGGHGGLKQSGTVTAVGSSSVTIKTTSGTTTYQVTANSDIDKDGEAKLSDLKVGDAVRFSSTTVNGQQVIIVLHAGNEALNRPSRPGGDHFGRLSQSGTVTAVGSSSVSIKTANGTTTYQVTANSDIDKNGEAKLSDLKVGDAVRFSSTTVNGRRVIVVLHAGNEALNRPNHMSRGGMAHTI
jgi:Cu/Ag efflux protein CusF